MNSRVKVSEMTLSSFRMNAGHKTGAALASAAKIPRSTIARMENGNDDSLAAREKVAKTLGLDLRKLHKLIDNARDARRERDYAEVRDRK